MFELDGGIFYEMNGGFQKEALERLVDYAYTSQLEIPGDEVGFMPFLQYVTSNCFKECFYNKLFTIFLSIEGQSSLHGVITSANGSSYK